MRHAYYKPSGAIGIAALWSYPLIGGLGAVASAAAYTLASHYIPFIYVKALLTIAFGFGILLSAGGAARVGKVRSEALNFLLALFVSAFALYVYWVFWFFVISDWEALILDPAAMWLIASQMAEEGLWSVRDLTPTGIWLYLFWLMEAGIVVVVAIFGAHSALKSVAFCEKCNQWADQEESIKPLTPLTNTFEFKAAFESSPTDSIRTLQRVGSAEVDHTEIMLKHCSKCATLSTISVVSVSVETDSKGKSEKKESEIIDRMLLDSAEYASIKEILAALTPTQVVEQPVP